MGMEKHGHDVIIVHNIKNVLDLVDKIYDKNMPIVITYLDEIPYIYGLIQGFLKETHRVVKIKFYISFYGAGRPFYDAYQYEVVRVLENVERKLKEKGFKEIIKDY